MGRRLNAEERAKVGTLIDKLARIKTNTPTQEGYAATAKAALVALATDNGAA